VAAPLDRPTDLAVPAEGSTTTRTILSRALGRVCRELPIVVRAQAAGDLRDDARALDRAIGLLAKRDPGAIASVLRRPHASTLVRVLRSMGQEGGALASELFALVAFDLAWIAALPCSVTLRRVPPRLVSRTARVAIDVPAGSHAVTFSNGKMTCEGAGPSVVLNLDALAAGTPDPRCTRPYVAIEDDLLLALADNNPLSAIEAHPDKTTPNTVDLGGHGEDEWVDSIRTALAVIETALPATARDIRLVLQQIVPTGFDAEKHLSCSYQEDIGTLYASLHPLPHTMAEALIHEVSHNKLNALLDIDPILENGRGELYASPVRPDPRPIHGVLLAVHAFVPVACMYERLIVRQASTRAPLRHLETRLAAVVESNRAGTAVLREHARPTPVGRGLLDELFAWDSHFRAAG
jgi:HEXXH motif-containing protein